LFLFVVAVTLIWQFLLPLFCCCSCRCYTAVLVLVVVDVAVTVVAVVAVALLSLLLIFSSNSSVFCSVNRAGIAGTWWSACDHHAVGEDGVFGGGRLRVKSDAFKGENGLGLV
jgi:hypothetical protein